MLIEIICTGDEVLTGKIVNTNFSYMAQKLEDVGLSVHWGTTVGDDRDTPAGGLPPRRRARRRGDRQWRARPDGRRSVAGDRRPGRRRRAGAERGMAGADGGVLRPPQPQSCRRTTTSRRCCRRAPRSSTIRSAPPAALRWISARRASSSPPACRASCGACSRSRSSRGCWPAPAPRPRSSSSAFTPTGSAKAMSTSCLEGVEALVPDGGAKLGFRAHYPQIETKLTVRGADRSDIERKLAPVRRRGAKAARQFHPRRGRRHARRGDPEGARRARRLARGGRDLYRRPDRGAHRAAAGRRERLPPRHRRARDRRIAGMRCAS